MAACDATWRRLEHHINSSALGAYLTQAVLVVADDGVDVLEVRLQPRLALQHTHTHKGWRIHSGQDSMCSQGKASCIYDVSQQPILYKSNQTMPGFHAQATNPHSYSSPPCVTNTLHHDGLP